MEVLIATSTTSGDRIGSLEERISASSTYELIRAVRSGIPMRSRSLPPFRKAWEALIQVRYREFLARVTQSANLFTTSGGGATSSPTSSQLPQTHFALWGAEAAGIANPINPLLEPAQIRDIMISAKTKVLVALGEHPGSEIWPKVEAIRREVPTLEAVIRVMGPSDESQGIYGYEERIGRYDAERLDSERRIEPRCAPSITPAAPPAPPRARCAFTGTRSSRL
jgi:fatty-acyl-CoA synthase